MENNKINFDTNKISYFNLDVSMEINKIGKIAKVLENNLSNLKLNLFKPEEKSLESNVSLKDIKNKFFNTEKESLDLNDNSPLSTFLNLKI